MSDYTEQEQQEHLNGLLQIISNLMINFIETYGYSVEQITVTHEKNVTGGMIHITSMAAHPTIEITPVELEKIIQNKTDIDPKLLELISNQTLLDTLIKRTEQKYEAEGEQSY